MVLEWLAGAALGSASGVALGCAFVHRLVKIEPVDYLTAVDISADDKDDIPMPQTAGKAVDVFQRQLLKDLSPWLTHPDYDRVLFINTVLEILWPHLSPAIHKMAVEQAKVPLADACKMAGGLLQEIRIDRLDLGTRPPRVDCFKSYETGEDELIVEAPAFWGGDIQLRVTAVVKAGTRTIDVPVDIANIQFKALSRITVKPLVDTLPCLGGVTLSLLETPHFNMDLRIGDSWDLMALPLVPTLVGTAIKVVAGKLLVYPNEFAYPLMPNFGLPPPPSGMLHVKVIGAKGLKGSMFDRMDAFVRLEVRKGRPVKTKVIPNNESPTWNEEFDFVVDNAAEQGLSLVLKDDDLLGASTEGVAVVPLQGAEFIARPRTPITLTVALRAPMDKSKSKRHNAAAAADGEGTGGSSSAAATPSTGVSPRTLAGDGGTPGSTAGSEKKKKKGFFNKGLAKLKFKKRPSETPGEAAEQAVADAVGGVLAGEGPPHGHGNSPDALQAAAEQPPAVQKAREVAEATPLATPGLELPAGALTGATVTVQCTYFPFKEAQSEGVSESQEGATASITSVRRTLVTTTQPDLTAKGVLTVNLTKCSGLEAAPDTYAVVTLYDPHRLPIPNIECRSEVVVNEDCPRYNFLCDFVNVSAASTLTAAIYEKAGTLDALKSLKLPFVSKANDKLLGKVRILVEEVAKEGRIRDLWPLQGAQTGDVHLGLEWNPATVAQAGAGTTPPGVV